MASWEKRASNIAGLLERQALEGSVDIYVKKAGGEEGPLGKGPKVACFTRGMCFGELALLYMQASNIHSCTCLARDHHESCAHKRG